MTCLGCRDGDGVPRSGSTPVRHGKNFQMLGYKRRPPRGFAERRTENPLAFPGSEGEPKTPATGLGSGTACLLVWLQVSPWLTSSIAREAWLALGAPHGLSSFPGVCGGGGKGRGSPWAGHLSVRRVPAYP